MASPMHELMKGCSVVFRAIVKLSKARNRDKVFRRHVARRAGAFPKVCPGSRDELIGEALALLIVLDQCAFTVGKAIGQAFALGYVENGIFLKHWNRLIFAARLVRDRQ